MINFCFFVTNSDFQLIVCGHSMSHAVNATLRDIVSYWRGDIGKLEFLQDGEKHPLDWSQTINST